MNQTAQQAAREARAMHDDTAIDLTSGDVPALRALVEEHTGPLDAPPAPSPSGHTYAVGMPCSVTVHEDGTVTVQLDLGELSEAIRGCESAEYDYEQAKADAAHANRALDARAVAVLSS